jgi:hypothetical protein
MMRSTARSPENHHVIRRLAATSLAAVVVGGVLGWTLSFAGLGPWGLVLGAAVGLLLMAAAARINPTQRFQRLLALGFGFVLLTWPVLWIVVGLVRFWITGDSLGS